MYKELEKYKTGKKVKTIGVLPNKQEVDINLEEYSFAVGDLVEDLIQHNKIYFWKKKYYHNHLRRIYVDTLNEIKINRGI